MGSTQSKRQGAEEKKIVQANIRQTFEQKKYDIQKAADQYAMNSPPEVKEKVYNISVTIQKQLSRETGALTKDDLIAVMAALRPEMITELVSNPPTVGNLNAMIRSTVYDPSVYSWASSQPSTKENLMKMIKNEPLNYGDQDRVTDMVPVRDTMPVISDVRQVPRESKVINDPVRMLMAASEPRCVGGRGNQKQIKASEEKGLVRVVRGENRMAVY